MNELIKRAAQTDPRELAEISRENLPEQTIENFIDRFEASSHKIKGGEEFWYARELQELLGYSKWENFETAIERAKVACQNSDQPVDNHFREVTKMVDLGSGSSREIKDLLLTRYACYLIAQNGDPRKEAVAFAQTYFAIQTRRQELTDKSGINFDQYHMGSAELAANLFRITQTEEKIRKDKIYGKELANKTHY